MNSAPNSDSEQYTESKLGWVHQVDTLAQHVRTGRAHCALAGHVASPEPAVSQAPSAVSWSCRWADHIVAHQAPCPGLSRDTLNSQASAPCHDTIVCIVTRLANQTAHLSRYKDCIVTQPPAASPSLMSRYKTLYCDTLYQPGCARARCRTPLHAAGRVVGMAGRVVGMAGRVVGRSPAPRPASSTLCHNTIHSIVTQKNNGPTSLCLFFFIFYFFILATGKPPKIFFFFSFSNKPNKFIEIYFIHFLSSFTHCKT